MPNNEDLSYLEKDEWWREFKANKYNEMPESIRTQAILALLPVVKEWNTSPDFGLIEKAIERRPDQWMFELGKDVEYYSFHMSTGMGIRNYLRHQGLTDDLLPDQNWDDYYMPVLERALSITYDFEFPWMENIDEH